VFTKVGFARYLSFIIHRLCGFASNAQKFCEFLVLEHLVLFKSYIHEIFTFIQVLFYSCIVLLLMKLQWESIFLMMFLLIGNKIKR